MSTMPTSHPIATSPQQTQVAFRSPSAHSHQALGGDAARLPPLPIIAICHLQWDWVWQRPQQFLSRLAQDRPVLFVETHRTDTPHGFARIRAAHGCPQVTIAEIHLPAHRWDDGGFIDAERRRILVEALTTTLEDRYAGAVLWFNDPMAVTAYAGHLGESLIVYDCMDELTQFQGAPPALAVRERELTRRADLIFCGGRKMREKRLPLNHNTQFYGTGVDCRHFGAAQRAETPIDPDVANLPGPVLGYFGVIDERLDYPLIAALADAFPGGSIVMVGPTAKVDPAHLPRRANLHWLGARPYARLPGLTKGFHVCLMPFALNASTEFINPTKALEYLACGRPVVSTALDEVRTNCSGAVRIAADHAAFIKMVHEEAHNPSPECLARGLALAARSTWDAITACLAQHITDTLAARRAAVPFREAAGTAQVRSNGVVHV